MRLALKLAIVFGMTLAILIPLTLIRGVIHDRNIYRTEAVADIVHSYAGKQSFAGPVLVVPYTDTVALEEERDSEQSNAEAKGRRKGVAKAKYQQITRYWTFFPDTLNVSGPLNPDTRKRGLHKVNVYEWQGLVTAHFEVKIPDDGPASAARRIGQPWLSYAIADVRGLRAAPQLRVDGQPMALEQGLDVRQGSGLHARLVAPTVGQSLKLDTELTLLLGGTESLALVPLGKSNRFALQSTWQHPSFGGRSPHHTLNLDGFKADWEIASVASDAQQQYLGGATLPEIGDDIRSLSGIDAVGVSLIDPVDVYTQADRATKYGLLFVLLTFVGFFLFELIKQLPIHPIQYALVGLGLAIFFLLLVSLSEHIEFIWAYLAASLACIGLLGFYLSAVLRSVVRGLGFAAMLTLLYAVLYGLLISEDNALVLGAGMLFLVLAAIMTVTRKIDWYAFAGRQTVARAAGVAN